MVYSLLLFLAVNFFTPGPAFAAEPADKRNDSIASIVVLRGKEVSVYSGNKKVKLETKDVPFAIYSGDEVEIGMDSDCELIMYNKDSFYAATETLFSLSWYRDELSTVWLRYGALMYRGESAVSVKTNDFSAITTKGNFVINYKRKNLEYTLLNLGREIKFKQGDVEASSPLLPNKYVKAVAFSGKRVVGNIYPNAIPKLYKLFRASFSPEGKMDIDKDVPGKGSEAAKFKSIDEANIDHVKRSIGI